MSSSSLCHVPDGLTEELLAGSGSPLLQVSRCAERQTGCSNKAEQTDSLFLHMLIFFCSSFFWLFFSASQCCLHWGPISEPTGSRPCSISGSLPKPPPSLFTTTEQQLYLNNNMSDPEKHKFNQTKEWNGREAGEEEQMSQNGTGWSFSVPKKQKGNRNAPSLPESSSILHLDVCAQTLTHTHSDAITCTFNSDQRTEHGRDVFYNCFSENVLHLFFTAENTA